jgi:hypothetical protein
LHARSCRLETRPLLGAQGVDAFAPHAAEKLAVLAGGQVTEHRVCVA